MKLSTIRVGIHTQAVRQDGQMLTPINDYSDLGELLQEPNWEEIAEKASGPRVHLEEANYAPVVPRPGKIICVGANYQAHIEEMGAEVPEYPTLFAKYAESLIGAADEIELPPEDSAVDWEAELAIVIGKEGRRIREEDAHEHIAGYTVANDVSMRTYQFRGMEWLQGKTWENSTPVGPVMVTPDEFDWSGRIQTLLDGDLVQDSPVNDLIFGQETLISYISTIVTLKPGDLILTGTPSGVGFGMEPQRFITDGSVLETRVDGIGVLRNTAMISSSKAVGAF